MACAEDALMPAIRAADRSTIVVADGFSCRTQIGHLQPTARPVTPPGPRRDAAAPHLVMIGSALVLGPPTVAVYRFPRRQRSPTAPWTGMRPSPSSCGYLPVDRRAGLDHSGSARPPWSGPVGARDRRPGSLDLAGAWAAMHRACRNIGSKGMAMQAISAVDVALWDLKARNLGVPITVLMGRSGPGPDLRLGRLHLVEHRRTR